MSMQRGCLVVERKAGEWYCAVADEEYDYDFEPKTYKVYGPAASEDAAFELMADQECNPGGFNTLPLGSTKPEEVEKLLSNGRKAERKRKWYR